jgi:hypothetical protein
MTLTTTRPSTVGGLLFPGTDPAGEIQQLLDDRAVLGLAVAALSRIPKTLAGAATKEIGSIIAGLLQMDLVDLLVSGWRKHGALASAAEMTLRSPGEKQVVGLATHRIRSTHTPSVELVVDRVPVGEVEFLIELGADVHALRAVVFGGRLTALDSGRIELSATLSCEGVELKSIRHEIDPSLEFDVGAGVPLIERLPPRDASSPSPRDSRRRDFDLKARPGARGAVL